MGLQYNEALQKSLEYFGGEELPARAFLDKYAVRDKDGSLLETTPDDMHWRIAKEIARVEKTKFRNPMTAEAVYEYLKGFARIIPQGSPMAGIGNTNQFSTLSNCYVLESPLDSYGGIHHTDQQLTQIAKRRGGTGLDISLLRPSEAPTTNSARTSSGIVTFMERYSNSIREVGQNGRRGALMITCSVHHPQIMDFISCKEDKTKITGANISVRLSNEFLLAVQEDALYEQRWPVDSETPQISRKVKAKTVWDSIVHHAWNRAEPGLLFWDKIISESPADCYKIFGFGTESTNPCSELPLSFLDSCRLLVLNLFYYVKNVFTKDAYFDYEGFAADAAIAQRFMDDIIDLEIECIDKIISKIKADPEPAAIKQEELDLWIKIRSTCVNGRRTGTGITALGDTLAGLGIAYGSDDSIGFTEKVYKTLKLACYRSSVEMAKELGPFPIFDYELEKNCPFLLRIKDEDPDLYEDMRKYGRRNIAILTTAPTGTTSMMAMLRIYLHNTTSGIEPCFMLWYIRRKKINPSDKSARVDFTDANGDMWQEFTIYHPALRYWMEVTGETDITKSPWHNCCAYDIDWQQRVKLQAAAQRHVDHAISSTINLPAEATEEQVGTIYLTLWQEDCKGGTVYRKDCRDGVLVENEHSIKKVQAIKRPKTLNCNIHHLTVKGHSYCALVGYLNGNENEPYEVFIVDNTKARIPKSMESGSVTKKSRGAYMLADEAGGVRLENIRDYCGGDSEEAIARLTSTSLRHGVDISFIVHQLEKTGGSLQTFAKALTRTLKKYIPDGTKVSGEKCLECKSENIIRQEGCVRCLECGWTKCS